MSDSAAHSGFVLGCLMLHCEVCLPDGSAGAGGVGPVGVQDCTV